MVEVRSMFMILTTGVTCPVSKLNIHEVLLRADKKMIKMMKMMKE